jgi:hypothetical protein
LKILDPFSYLLLTFAYSCDHGKDTKEDSVEAVLHMYEYHATGGKKGYAYPTDRTKFLLGLIVLNPSLTESHLDLGCHSFLEAPEPL